MRFGVYCVCLPSRREHADAFFAALNLSPTYTPIQLKDFDRTQLIETGFLHPESNLNRGEIACAISHHNAWKVFLQQPFDYGIFFEDDNVIPTQCVDFEDILRKMEAHECLFLNLSPCWSRLTLCKGFCKPTGVCLNAYMMHKTAAAEILQQTTPLRKPIDHFHIHHGYELHPRLFNQLGPQNTTLNNIQGTPEFYNMSIVIVFIVIVLCLSCFIHQKKSRC